MNNSNLLEQFPTLFEDESRIETPDGWVTLVAEMLISLKQEQANTPAMRISQIKQKWGELRVYGENISEPADRIIREARGKAKSLCDACGSQGTPKSDYLGRVVAVRCAEHGKQVDEQRAASLAKESAAINLAKVGIFFVVNGDIIFDAVQIEKGEPYGDTVGFGGHHDYWLALDPTSSIEHLFKEHAYDYFPRGRVVYFNKGKIFKLYADHCLTEPDIKNIVTAFQLPSYRLARDEHYQCAKCNAEYVDI